MQHVCAECFRGEGLEMSGFQISEMQGGALAARVAHNDEAPGSIPGPATSFHSAVSVGEVNGDGRGPLNAIPPGGVLMEGAARGTEAPEFQSREEFLAACAIELAACVAAKRRVIA